MSVRESSLQEAWGVDPAVLGIHRALEPHGALTHMARVLDAQTPATDYEVSVDVELLAVDATSFRAIRERCGGDAERMAETIASIVAERGKLQNPWTGSGGVLMGRVLSVGSGYQGSSVQLGQRVVALGSLIAIPLRLDSVGPVDPTSSHVPARGRAIVTGRMPCVAVPDDLGATATIAALDVYPAASYARSLARPGDHVLVLGSGHAGLLAIAAAREVLGSDGLITAVDCSPPALERAVAVDPGSVPVEADVTDPMAVAGSLADAGRPRGDLTLQCTNTSGAEGAAILSTDERGTIVFFSTATTFAAAGLGADAIGSQAQLIIPNGLTDDRGDYALELLRRIAPLREAFEGAA
jgi:L-erythro-3,5-diaminohexanoate dehydrogenase